ncbi:MAG: hypothetical protein C0417_02990 [Chlorobiaceae bacterium]|nr:hypothetical protein [Chlorobiaceae bacterium]
MIKENVREQIMMGMAKSELKHFQFSKIEATFIPKWKEPNEFDIDGEMYDIVYFQESNDSISYWCWQDRDETKLNKKLNTLINQKTENSPLHHIQLKQIASFLSTLFFIDKLFWQATAPSTESFASNNSSLYLSYIKSPPIPPP